MADRTEHGVEWCRRCHTHQALATHGGICPVCDPDRSQTTGVRERAQAALDAIDNALTPPPTPTLEQIAADEHERRRRDVVRIARAFDIPADLLAPQDGQQARTTTHQVHRVGITNRFSRSIWHGHRDDVFGMLRQELDRHAAGAHEWVIVGSEETQVSSVYRPRRRRLPPRWWHRITLGYWKPPYGPFSEEHVTVGEHGDADLYEVRMLAYSVDLPPERHPAWPMHGGDTILTLNHSPAAFRGARTYP